jgi:heterotetrameric sarcosine oxidase gamma subunit
VTLAFLSPASRDDVLAESPFAAAAGQAGAVFGARHGWRVPVAFGDDGLAERAVAQAVGWADASHLGKLELQTSGAHADALSALAGGLAFGTAVRHRDAWWCRITPAKALVLAEPAAAAAVREELDDAAWLDVLDVSTQLAALRIAGPSARETFARFCALDLRPTRAPVGSFLPGSVARTPGYVLREDGEQYLALVGAAYASSFWEVVADAGGRLGGLPVGVDRLSTPAAEEEAGAHA